jgi:hypothetical protein
MQALFTSHWDPSALYIFTVESSILPEEEYPTKMIYLGVAACLAKLHSCMNNFQMNLFCLSQDITCSLKSFTNKYQLELMFALASFNVSNNQTKNSCNIFSFKIAG